MALGWSGAESDSEKRPGGERAGEREGRKRRQKGSTRKVNPGTYLARNLQGAGMVAAHGDDCSVRGAAGAAEDEAAGMAAGAASVSDAHTAPRARAAPRHQCSHRGARTHTRVHTHTHTQTHTRAHTHTRAGGRVPGQPRGRATLKRTPGARPHGGGGERGGGRPAELCALLSAAERSGRGDGKRAGRPQAGAAWGAGCGAPRGGEWRVGGVGGSAG